MDILHLKLCDLDLTFKGNKSSKGLRGHMLQDKLIGHI